MDRILTRLHDGGSVAVSGLAQQLGVSDMTIRRDLAELERSGLLERVHGGARRSPAGPLRVIDTVEPNFMLRMDHDLQAKEVIAVAVGEMLAQVRTIAVDVGSTTFQAIKALLALKSCEPNKRFFTNSLRVAEIVAMDGRHEVYVPGGRVRGDELSITGPGAVADFGQFRFDAALIGVSGVTEDGLYDFSIEDSEMKRVLLERSENRIVLCDSSKFRRLSTVHIGPLETASRLVTEREPPAGILSALRGAGVDLKIAGHSAPATSEE